MGKTSVVAPGTFASQMNRFLQHLVKAQGGDASGRWLERKTDGKRKKDYWKSLTDDVQAMNTNDIAILAAAFDMNPYEFVRSARDWGDGEEIPAPIPIRPVGPSVDDVPTEEEAYEELAVAQENVIDVEGQRE